MKEFKRLAHAVWECKYHIVWCPKYRFKILTKAVRKSVREIIRQLCVRIPVHPGHPFHLIPDSDSI